MGGSKALSLLTSPLRFFFFFFFFFFSFFFRQSRARVRMARTAQTVKTRARYASLCVSISLFSLAFLSTLSLPLPKPPSSIFCPYSFPFLHLIIPVFSFLAILTFVRPPLHPRLNRIPLSVPIFFRCVLPEAAAVI